MAFTFKQLKKNQKSFFEILPKDWQDEIVPFWTRYQDDSQIYVILENSTIVGGGIIFSKPPPNQDYFEASQLWFDNGYLYIGFLWINEDKRNNNLGSFWLEELKKNHPEHKYWLLIEEERLHRFYQKNGFTLNIELTNDDHHEWLYSFES